MTERTIIIETSLNMGFPGGSVVKDPPVNAGDLGLIPGSERSPEEGNGYPLRYSCLGQPMDWGAWCTAVHGVTKESDTAYWLKQTIRTDRVFLFFFLMDWESVTGFSVSSYDL